MGKLNGLIKITGTFDNLTFYKTADGYFVRTKGGISKQRILTDSAFVRTRENISEFTHTAQAAKLFRQSVGLLLHHAKDSKLSSRMMQLFYKIKNLDLISPRGSRKIGLSTANENGKLLLKGFDFNIHAPLSSILSAPFLLDTTTGSFSFADLVPELQVRFPEGATHVQLRCGFVVLDFQSGIFNTSYSPPISLAFSSLSSTVTLIPDAVPNGTGLSVHLLQVSFHQEVNGISYALHNGYFNSLQIIEVL
jgi:hypothetical protein